MKLAEICFWDALYMALYLPFAIMAMVMMEAEVNLVGVLAIGVFYCAILSLYLSFQGNVLCRDPIAMRDGPIKKTNDSKTTPSVEVRPTPAQTPQKEVIKSKRRRRRKKVDQFSEETNKDLEVQPDVQEKEPNISPAKDEAFFIGDEPEPKMRTNVDLGKLDADDDDILG